MKCIICGFPVDPREKAYQQLPVDCGELPVLEAAHEECITGTVRRSIPLSEEIARATGYNDLPLVVFD